MYLALYSPKGASYDELYDALREMVSELLAAGVVLLGDHGDGELDGMGSADGHLDERSPILFEIVRQIVERWPQPPDPIAGRSLSDLLRNESVHPRSQRSNRAVPRKSFALGRCVGTQRHPPANGRGSQRDYDTASRTGSPVDRIGCAWPTADASPG